ncbi:MAG: fimbrillin family protein, partial [Bacteroidaceae bacterium]|nr:fimbrillin family protein [Bacteroidaceae bacterium]
YWPDEALDFAAVSPAGDPRITVSRGASGATTVTYEFDGDNENTTTTNLMHADFVVGQTKAIPTVALGFRHALAKLNVVLHQNAVDAGSLPTGVSGYEVVLQNVRINNILCQGTLTVTANDQNTTDRVWNASSPAATTNWNILTSANQPIKAADYATAINYYVMPQTLADATTITIDYDVISTLTSGGTSKLAKSATVKLNDIYKSGSSTEKITDWFTNKVITYTFNLNPTAELTPIAFTAQEEEWGTVGGSHTF